MKSMSYARLRTPVAAILAASLTAAAVARAARAENEKKLKVVTTLHVLASITSEVGGDHVEVKALARPVEDPHEVTATPQRYKELSTADAFVESGFQLEIWDENVISGANNSKIQKAADGFCKAGAGTAMLEIPANISRQGGDLHPDGNPHIWYEPFAGHIYAKNIEACLSRVDSANSQLWEKNRKAFDKKLDEAIFGPDLCKVLGGPLLEKLARSGKLDTFLAEHKVPKGYNKTGEPLKTLLGGLMKKAEPLKGAKLLAYHKSWCYFAQAYGCEVIGAMEPKPGIPPTAGHLEEIEKLSKQQGAKVILCMSYEPMLECEEFAEKIGGAVALMPSDVGAEDTKDFIGFQTMLVERAVAALGKSDKEK